MTQTKMNRRMSYRTTCSYSVSCDDDRRLFVDAHPLFLSWPPALRDDLAKSFVIRKFPAGSNLVEQSISVDGLYFITGGAVRVSMDVDLHTTQYPFLHISEATGAHSGKTEAQCGIAIKPNTRRQLSYKDAENRCRSKRIDFAFVELGDGIIVGDCEVLLNLPTYLATVTVTEEVLSFFIDSRSFLRLAAEQQNVLAELTKQLRLKLDHYTTSKQTVHLFRVLQREIKNLHIANSDQKFKQIERTLFERTPTPRSADLDPESKLIIQNYLVRDGSLVRPMGGALKFKDSLRNRAVKREEKKLKQEAMKSGGVLVKDKTKDDQEARDRRLMFGMKSTRKQFTIQKAGEGNNANQSGPAHTRRNNLPAEVSEDEAEEKPVFITELRRSSTIHGGRRVSLVDQQRMFQKRHKSFRRMKEAIDQHRLDFFRFRSKQSDWMTGDRLMGNLEKRVETFCERFPTEDGSTWNLPKLNRFVTSIGHDNQPKVGGRVYVKKSPCPQMSSSFRIANHHHTRHEIVHRLPERTSKTKAAKNLIMQILYGY